MFYINKKYFRAFLHDKKSCGFGILFQKYYDSETYLEIHLFKLRIYIGKLLVMGEWKE